VRRHAPGIRSFPPRSVLPKDYSKWSVVYYQFGARVFNPGIPAPQALTLPTALGRLVMGLFETGKKLAMPDADRALPGRAESVPVPATHFVNGNPMQPPFPDQLQVAQFGMGCFWGVERKFWQVDGVYTTAAGYGGGYTPNPGYEEVCSGLTGHNEVVLVVFDPAVIAYDQLLNMFWEGHNPTQGMRQGNDMGTQYRLGIYTYSAQQLQLAESSLVEFQSA
jgi:peptide-methionine (S)-S-oxide reductase